MQEDDPAGGQMEDGQRPLPRPEKYLHPDSYLQFLVSLANELGFGETTDGATFSLTVHVHGMIVSGQLISLRAFFKHLGDSVRAAQVSGAGAPTGQVEGVASALEEAGVRFINNASEVDKATPCYIHLRDVHVYPSLPAVHGNYAITGAVWRGRLAAVDGFHLGTSIYQVEKG